MIERQTYRAAAQACPRCNCALDAFSEVNAGARPGPGDLSVCLHCGLALRFGSALELIALSQAEIARLPADARAELSKARAAVATAMAAGYARCVAKLDRAAAEFVSEHGSADLLFTLPPDAIGVCGPLSGRSLDALGANERSREFLRHLDEATDHEATIAMAIEMILATELPTGEAGTPSPWAFLFLQGGEPS